MSGPGTWGTSSASPSSAGYGSRTAEEELQAFAKERQSATLLQASATVVGAFLPLTAVIFYLAVSVFFVIDPLRHMRARVRRPAGTNGNARPAEY
jgi:hypothetical protein